MSTLAQFIQAFHGFFTQNPNRRVVLGVEERLGELPDPSQHAAQRECEEARELLRAVAELRREPHDFETSLDLELAALQLEHALHARTYRWNGLTHVEQCPRAGDEIGDGIFLLFINDPRPAGERLRDITSRLEAVPDYLDAQLARLAVPLQRWVEIELSKLEGLPQLFENIADWAAAEDYPDRARLLTARERAEAALSTYQASLRELPTSTSLHVGPEIARDIVRLRGVDLSFDDLHRIAKRFLRQVTDDLEQLRGRLLGKYALPPTTSVTDLEALLKQRFMVALPDGKLEHLLQRYTVERDRLLSFVRERELFPILDDQALLILRTPRFMEPSIPAGAMLSPAPFRQGTKTSLVYLTLSEELRAEHTELSIPSMMIHEGIPGHHLQLATAAAHPSVIRRHIDAMDQAEGWTTMLEDYMLDQGYLGELTDEARFIGRRDIARIAARVAIDLFFMTGDTSYLDLGTPIHVEGGDPFESAAILLSSVTGFVPGRVQAELNWYSLERGYPLSYLAGNHLVWQLKRDVQAAQAGQRSALEIDRLFHHVFLSAGNMPVSRLRSVFAHRGLLPAAEVRARG